MDSEIEAFFDLFQSLMPHEVMTEVLFDMTVDTTNHKVYNVFVPTYGPTSVGKAARIIDTRSFNVRH